MKLNAPILDHVCNIEVDLGPIQELGNGRAGKRRIIPIVGGVATGPRLNGRVLNVGADWQTVFDDGLAELDTRYALETHDGATIEIINYGYRFGDPDVLKKLAKGEHVSPDQYYMRTQARLETGDPRYSWVNHTLFVGTGARHSSSVTMAIYEIV